jgi:hypothetical protein
MSTGHWLQAWNLSGNPLQAPVSGALPALGDEGQSVFG